MLNWIKKHAISAFNMGRTTAIALRDKINRKSKAPTRNLVLAKLSGDILNPEVLYYRQLNYEYPVATWTRLIHEADRFSSVAAATAIAEETGDIWGVFDTTRFGHFGIVDTLLAERQRFALRQASNQSGVILRDEEGNPRAEVSLRFSPKTTRGKSSERLKMEACPYFSNILDWQIQDGHLKCAVNPTTPCLECNEFNPEQCQD